MTLIPPSFHDQEFDEAARQELIHDMAREIYIRAVAAPLSRSQLISPHWVKRHAFAVATAFYTEETRPQEASDVRKDHDGV